jgi:hypothetical protein
VTLGAEPKKIAFLVVLLVGVAVTLYINVFSGDSSAPAPRAAVTAAVPAQVFAPNGGSRAVPKQRRSGNHGGAVEFKPRQGPDRPEDRVDPATVDPTLRLDLLAKVQNVEPEEATRNLFQYGTPVAANATAPKAVLPTNVPKINVTQPKPTGPPPPPGPPPDPIAPKMTFKYYGYKVSKLSGRKQAFLLDGEDIIIAGEDEVMKSARYKVLRIGTNSITIEDTQFKSSQTIPLQEEAAS